MAGAYASPQPSEGPTPRGRGMGSRAGEAELLLQPEEPPVQLSRGMFASLAARPGAAPLTNQHLQRAAGLAGGGGGAPPRSPKQYQRQQPDQQPGRRRSAAARSVAASSVRGGRAGFSVVSDEEVIDVDGEPTTLADEDLDPEAEAEALDEMYDNDMYDNDMYEQQQQHAGGAAVQHAEGAGGGGEPDPLEVLEGDTPLVRLAEVQRDLEAEMQRGGDPWVCIHLAQLALGHAKVAAAVLPGAVAKEEPLLLARAHAALAAAYQRHGCERQAAEHGRLAVAAIPPEVAATEAAAALRCEVLVLRAEALLAIAAAGVAAAAGSGAAGGGGGGEGPVSPEGAHGAARKALGLLVRAAGLEEPVAWTHEEAEENELPGHARRATIDKVSDLGVLALMAQCWGLAAEARMRGAAAVRAEQQSCLRSADETAARLERRTDRGDALYPPEQQERWRLQERHFRDEARGHAGEVVRLAGEAERAFDAALYCINQVIDCEGRRLEEAVGRAGKVAHPTFRALWVRSLDLMAGSAEAYGLQGKAQEQLRTVNEVLSAYAQYDDWLPPGRHVRALKDRGALLVAAQDYDGALATYDELAALVAALWGAADPARAGVQGAEVAKLRGDVALAAGDFRAAQHAFAQALDAYTRHLGPGSGVARDLAHRMEEVKAYLADTRVMGRLASFPGRSGSGGASSPSPAATPKAASVAGRSSAGPRSPLLGSASPSTSGAASGLRASSSHVPSDLHSPSGASAAASPAATSRSHRSGGALGSGEPGEFPALSVTHGSVAASLPSGGRLPALATHGSYGSGARSRTGLSDLGYD